MSEVLFFGTGSTAKNKARGWKFPKMGDRLPEEHLEVIVVRQDPESSLVTRDFAFVHDGEWHTDHFTAPAPITDVLAWTQAPEFEP